ncbi:hydantoinase/oxoprolinase N-terminal domain-containing protein, partial [Geminicoccus flavidas]|uniref:hydantoinase/oxoprolinase N-terminal domain-containing protein n=1 Tax=Geminicoccus flavidas TaxID=2506407 RepID=UPI002AB1E6A0
MSLSGQSQEGMPAVGIDVGGTFTDFVVVMPDGSLLQHKQPSTPADPSRAVGEGLRALTARHPALAGRTLRIVHGTTLALNAILQRKVADVALVVAKGGRDVLEIGRAKLKTPYNFHLGKEQAVVPRDLIFEIDARVAADGAVLARPDEAAVDALCREIAASRAGAVAIMLLNAYVDPTLEIELGRAIAARL